MESGLKLFAYYLPQFHSIPENDEWWGKGFTEWTNVKKAKSLFRGHKQPLIPRELGYYNLDNNETIREQANLAKDHGIDGFVFYHYWFGDSKILLEKPILNFLNDPTIDIQFCICWANESWKGTWHGAAKGQMLQEQKYLGMKDYSEHFDFLRPFFLDDRCLKIDDMPVYQVYVPESIPDFFVYKQTFDRLAKESGLKGIYWMGVKTSAKMDYLTFGLNGIVNSNLRNLNRYHSISFKGLIFRYLLSNPLVRKINKWPKKIPYQVVRACLEDFKESYSMDFFPLAIPNWDNTPRVGTNGTVYVGATPSEFKKHLQSCVNRAKINNHPEKQLVFVKSWNEWAEGNILEPEKRFGLGYLEVVKELVNE